ncbi:MAG: 3'-5' exonuclease [Rhizomicrobium sp.]
MLCFVALDFETANTAADSACEIGLARFEDGALVAQQSWYIRPPTPELRFTYLHGIDWEMVKDAPDFGTLLPEIEDFIAGADFLAAHNAAFDARVLRTTAARYDRRPPSQPFLCTVKLARAVWNIYPTKLPDVCSALDIELGRHHRAGFDAEACGHIVRHAAAHLGEAAFRTQSAPLLRPA